MKMEGLSTNAEDHVNETSKLFFIYYKWLLETNELMMRDPPLEISSFISCYGRINF